MLAAYTTRDSVSSHFQRNCRINKEQNSFCLPAWQGRGGGRVSQAACQRKTMVLQLKM